MGVLIASCRGLSRRVSLRGFTLFSQHWQAVDFAAGRTKEDL
jgi:hypothetical protein